MQIGGNSGNLYSLLPGDLPLPPILLSAHILVGEPESGVTVNIGQISGGEANNIVPDCCKVSGEIRSLSHGKVLNQWEQIKAVFEQETQVTGAKATANGRIEITAYETPLDSVLS